MSTLTESNPVAPLPVLPRYQFGIEGRAGVGAEIQGSYSDPILAHPTRAVPNPLDGSVTIDPEIDLIAPGMKLRIGFFYATDSTANGAFGRQRSASVNAFITPGDTTIQLTRGDQTHYIFNQSSVGGGITNYVADTTNFIPSTISFDGTTYTEHFPDGSAIDYVTQIGGSYYIYRAKSPAGAVHTYQYGSGAEAGLLKTIKVPDGKVLSLAYVAGNPTSLLSSVEDWGGRILSFQYDTNRNLTTMTAPIGCQTAYAYTLQNGNYLVSSI